MAEIEEKDQLEQEQYREFIVEDGEDQLNAAEEAALAAAQPLDEEKDSEEASVRKIVDAFTSDEDEEIRINWSLPSVLGGDILNAKWFRKHAALILLVIALTILYITNRYASQQEIIKIDALKKELADKRYDALTRSSQLLQRCRESQIEEILKSIGDTTLGANTEPPFEIKLND